MCIYTYIYIYSHYHYHAENTPARNGAGLCLTAAAWSSRAAQPMSIIKQ